MRDYAGPLAQQLGDRYSLEGELGRGGTAIVYRARDVRLGRTVAIKVFDPQLVGTLGAERFIREIALEAQLNHPHIVPLLDTGEVEGTPYFIMPCIEGETLRSRLDRERELPLDDAVQIARDVAVALQYAHERGIVHRDIKPENILLTAGTAVVGDFGIARALSEAGASRLTQTGIALGTVPYMSPEQSVEDPTVDGRSDIYSLGCTLFEMLVGESPHTGPTAQAIIAKRLSEPPRSARQLRASVSPALDRVVQRSLAVSPADRFATAKDFIDALARARTGETDVASVAPAPDRVAPPASASTLRSSPAIKRLVAVIALGVLAGAGYLWSTRTATPPVGNAMAVLPFTDISEKQDQAFFALGMAEELIRALTRLPGLRVTGRTSSFALRDTRDDIATIAQRLNVTRLLTGSVRREGDSLRISAELVKADGTSLWRSTYDRTLSDVFAVQEEIAQAIATELSVELGPQQALIAPATKDVGAYQLYLRARLAWAQRTPESSRRPSTTTGRPSPSTRRLRGHGEALPTATRRLRATSSVGRWITSRSRVTRRCARSHSTPTAPRRTPRVRQSPTTSNTTGRSPIASIGELSRSTPRMRMRTTFTPVSCHRAAGGFRARRRSTGGHAGTAVRPGEHGTGDGAVPGAAAARRRGRASASDRRKSALLLPVHLAGPLAGAGRRLGRGDRGRDPGGAPGA